MSFATATALGGDAIRFRQIASLPDEALEEMDANFQEMAAEMVWPQQLWVSYMALLAKKSGGNRTIAIMASSVRLFLAAAVAPLRRWDAEVALEGDTAAPGRCAVRAVAMRALVAEIAQARGKEYLSQLVRCVLVCSARCWCAFWMCRGMVFIPHFAG